MVTIPVGQAVLKKVVAQLGGTDEAAERLGLSPTNIRRLLDGTVPVPDAVLLLAVDIVFEESQPFAISEQA